MVSVRILTLFLFTIALASGQPQTPLANRFDSGNLTPKPSAEPLRKLSPEERGDVFMARKMYREAIEAYREGPKTSPVLANKIGIAWHQLGSFTLARKSYEQAIRLDKTYADAVNNLGTIFYAQKRYKTAVARYRKAIDLAPDRASFWSNLGTAWYSRGKYAEMAKAYHQAMELDPNVFEHRGMVGTELQDRTVADRARFHFELARMYAQKGNKELALQYLRKSLEEGLKDKDKMVQAPEFAELRETEEFKTLLTLEPRVL